MSQSFRVVNSFKKPDPHLVEKFRDIPVANIADNMGRISCLHYSVRPMNKAKLLGCAFTVKVPAGDNLMFHQALDMAEPGDVIVVAGEGYSNRSLCGAIMANYAKSRNLNGFVIDGAIRDISEISEMDFPVYAKSVQPNGPYKNGPGEINVPVSCAGQVIFPGDILVGDMDGIVAIRPDEAEMILLLAMKQNQMETQSFIEIEKNNYDRKWVLKTLIDKGCEFFE